MNNNSTMTPVMAYEPSPPLKFFIEAAERLEKQEQGQVPPWLVAQRTAGLAEFAEQGIPTPKQEDWKYTNLQGLTQLEVSPVETPDQAGHVTREQLAPYSLASVAAAEFVFVDGHYQKELSFIGPKAEGVKMTPLAQGIRATDCRFLEEHLGHNASVREHVFAGLNMALFYDGASLLFPKDLVVHAPIHLLFITTGPVWVNPRVLIVSEAHSSASVIESFASVGEEAAFTNTVTEAVVGEGANIQHFRLHRENQKTYYIGLLQAELARASHFANHSIALGGKLTRNDISLHLNGEGVDGVLNGLYMPGGDQLMDFHTEVDHRVPHCESHEFYHGILNHQARGVFNGKIYVQPHAQKTNAKQSNRAMLLSPQASVDTKPQLEIWADDVKCTHGATVGEMDETAIFYMRSRGIPEGKARQMLIRAFAEEIVSRIEQSDLQEYINNLILKHLDHWK